MNIIRKISYILMTGVALIAATSCSDIADEITSLNLSRALRPTDVTVKIVDKVNAKVSAYFVTEPDEIVLKYYIADANDSTKYTTLDREDKLTCKDPGAEHVTITTTTKALYSETNYKLVMTSSYKGKSSEAVEVLFATDAEQILKDVTDDDLTSKSVTLSWDPELAVTRIAVVKSDEVLQDITLTDADKAAGTYTVTGLDPERKYTFYIYNGDKQRGKVVASTLPDYIPVYADRNVDIQSIIDTAEDGQTIMLLPSQDGSTSAFVYESEEGARSTKQLNINKSLTISCLDTKPVTASLKFFLQEGCKELTIKNITLTGSSSDAFLKIGSANADVVNLYNLEISGYKNFIPNDKDNAGVLQTLNVKNCFFHDMSNGARFVDMQSSRANDIRVQNYTQNTFANLGSGSDFIRVDFVASMTGSEVYFTNNTVYKVEATSKGMFYIRSNANGNKEFTCKVFNNIFSDCSDKVYYSQDAKTDNIEYFGNYYNGCPSLQAPLKEGTTYDAEGTDADPKFVDAEHNDFTITNETLLDKNIGNTEFVKK